MGGTASIPGVSFRCYHFLIRRETEDTKTITEDSKSEVINSFTFWHNKRHESRFWTVSRFLFKWSTWRTILFYVFIYIFNSLHVSSISCSSSVETNCVNTTSGSCHSVSCAGRKTTSDLHTTRQPTQSDSYHVES